MRKQTYLCIALLMAAMVAAPIYAASASGSSLDALSIYSLQMNPDPVFAGSNMTVNLQLYNSFTSSLQNVNLEMEGSYPIVNVSPSNPYLISSISQGLYGGINTYFTYSVRVPKNTPSGNYTIDLVAKYETSQTSSTGTAEVTGESVMPITFYVHGTPRISINPSVSSISPGQPSSVTLDVMNSGYGTARNITVSTMSSDGFSATGTRKFYIGSLQAGSSTLLTATYLAGTHITNGTYLLPVYVAYQSDQGTNYSQTINQTIGVKIQSPDIVASILSADPSTLYAGYNQTLTIGLENVGYGDANNVSVNIGPIGGINILSSVHHFFIGSLDAGQTATKTILVTAANNTGAEGLLASMQYYSSNYQDMFLRNQSLNLSVASSAIFSLGTRSYRILPGGTTVPVNLTVTNTGSIDAQQLQLSLQSSYPLTPVAGSGYIENLEPGQTANVSFLVSVDSHGTPGNYPITIYETWRQPNGAAQQSYTGSSSYYATVSSPSSAGGAYNLVGYAVIAAVVIIAIRFAYKRYMKTGRKRKSKEQ